MRASLCHEVIVWLACARQCEFDHIHRNDRSGRAAGGGVLAFSPILAALKAEGYAGMAAIEPFIYEPDGPSCAARAIGYVRGLLEMRDGTAPCDANADKA